MKLCTVGMHSAMLGNKLKVAYHSFDGL